MQALIGARSNGDASSAEQGEGEALPSFGGVGLDGLSATPLLSPTPPPAPAVRPRRADQRLYAIASVLAAAVLGLGAVMAMKLLDPEPAPAVVAASQAPDPGELEPAPEQPAAAPEQPETPGDEVDEPASEAPPPSAEGAAPPKPRARSRTHKSTPKQDSPSAPTVASSSEPAPSEAKQAEAIDVDCLIDKNLPKCKTGASSPAPSEPKPTPKPAVDPDLPAKLGQSEILAGVTPIKTAAKACGSSATVEIKFSVRGSTGAVVSATPLGEHASTAVGACVAKAAKQASFAKFGAEQQGFTFKFRL